MNYTNAPKVELHLHLDCSLSYKVANRINPSITLDYYKENFVAPAKCNNLADYISRAVKGFELMQTKEQLRLVTLDLFDQLKADNVLYAEIRFAPLLHIEKGLDPEEVVEAVNNATAEGVSATGVEAGVILCTCRHFTAAQSMKTVQLVKQFNGTSIVGFDIAADEAGFSIDNHIAAFEFANANNINCTAHAGEAKGAESIWETLKYFKPSRIGHGVRSAEDPKLMDYLKEHNIHLEVCPTSNVQTNVFDTIENHSANKIFDAGISMSVNTDARAISNVTLAEEYNKLKQVFEWNTHHIKTCNLAAIGNAFTTNEIKSTIRQKIESAYS
jgi:adenosine deaminase